MTAREGSSLSSRSGDLIPSSRTGTPRDVRDQTGPSDRGGLVHVWSTCHRNPAAPSALQRDVVRRSRARSWRNKPARAPSLSITTTPSIPPLRRTRPPARTGRQRVSGSGSDSSHVGGLGSLPALHDLQVARTRHGSSGPAREARPRCGGCEGTSRGTTHRSSPRDPNQDPMIRTKIR